MASNEVAPVAKSVSAPPSFLTSSGAEKPGERGNDPSLNPDDYTVGSFHDLPKDEQAKLLKLLDLEDLPDKRYLRRVWGELVGGGILGAVGVAAVGFFGMALGVFAAGFSSSESFPLLPVLAGVGAITFAGLVMGAIAGYGARCPDWRCVSLPDGTFLYDDGTMLIPKKM